jgi:hypothetical protein
VNVEVLLSPTVCGILETALSVAIHFGKTRFLSVTANVQHPQVRVGRLQADVGLVYVNKQAEFEIPVTNVTALPANYSWDDTVLGEDGDEFDVSFDVPSGTIPPHGKVITRATVTPRVPGRLSAVLALDVHGMPEPAGVRVLAEVRGVELAFEAVIPVPQSPDEIAMLLADEDEAMLWRHVPVPESEKPPVVTFEPEPVRHSQPHPCSCSDCCKRGFSFTRFCSHAHAQIPMVSVLLALAKFFCECLRILSMFLLMQQYLFWL